MIGPKTLGVVAQVILACRSENRLAALLGALLGGFVPVASFVLAHYEIDPARPLWSQLPPLLVVGGLCYSATSVYQWAQLAFGSGFKALGFCILLEGVMTTSGTPWLALAALGYLVAINSIATGCRLALSRASKRVATRKASQTVRSSKTRLRAVAGGAR